MAELTTFRFRSVKAKKGGRTLYMAIGVLPKEETCQHNGETITAKPSANILLDSDRQDDSTNQLLDAYAQGDDIKRKTAKGLILALQGESRSFEVEIKNSHINKKFKTADNPNVDGGIAIYASLTLDAKVKVLEALVEALDEFVEDDVNVKA